MAVERRLPASVEFLLVRDHVFERLAPSTTPQPMLAIVARPVASLPAAPSVVLVLAGVSDPGNLGTLVRAADAVAADAVVVVGGADPWGPKAVRASAGSMLRVPIVQYDQLSDAVDALRDAGVTVVGTDVTDGEPFDQGVLDRPVAIVMGSEPQGLDRDVDLDAWAHIAMPGRTESRKVAKARTLLHYQACRTRSGEQVLLLGTLSDVGVGEGAQRHDLAVRRSQVGEDPCHETIGHALAAVSRVGLDVGDHDGVAPFVVIGDRHDVAVDDKFVPLALGDVSTVCSTSAVWHERVHARRRGRRNLSPR